MKLILVGAVTKAHGLKGEVQILPFNPDSEIWQAGGAVILVRPGIDGYPRDRKADVVDTSEGESVEILAIRKGGQGRLIGTLTGISDREASDQLKGAVLGVPSDELGPLEPDEYWYHEVGGWSVVTEAGEPVGTVVRALATHIELFEVRPSAGGETFYLPVLPHYVTHIDRDEGRVVIDPVEGLIP